MDCKNCEKLKSDLLIAQAAIADVVNQAERDFENAPYQIDELYFDKLKTVDLSALDKHDAELRHETYDLNETIELLVKMLKEFEDEYPHVSAVLAKVKE